MPEMIKLPGTRLKESSFWEPLITGIYLRWRLEEILLDGAGLEPGCWALILFNNPQKINPISSHLINENGFSYNAETGHLLCNNCALRECTRLFFGTGSCLYNYFKNHPL
jgi:hypothetical protein